MTIYVHRQSRGRAIFEDDTVWRAGSASPPDSRNFHIPDVLKLKKTGTGLKKTETAVFFSLWTGLGLNQVLASSDRFFDHISNEI